MDPIAGGSGHESANKFKRILADVFDLIIVPLILGAILGFFLLNVSEAIRNVFLIVFNVGWLVLRDAVFSPGRAITGLKIISLSGDKVTVAQAFIRNVLLIIPIVLLVGYIVELISVLAQNRRVADGWAKTQVVAK
jgi:uncharacterized RDD family membrane protein YckC